MAENKTTEAERIELELIEASEDNQLHIYANNFRCAHIDNMVSLRADNIDLFDWNKQIATKQRSIQIKESTTVTMSIDGLLKLKGAIDQLYKQLQQNQKKPNN
jgi:hypothetical protein